MENAALMAPATHQLVGLSLQVSGEGQEIHQSYSFIQLKQQNLFR